ncbi:hypothetical protein FKG94_05485 [Exilibacterium tricleocarpae]|uniref:Uncharacterized protein n=1 Tax=Exilibacterium tricleocarpae TaxID=2591008 RepID=A0A545U3T6_9GAMM|nr:hypothetical protein [Exilibacterium tricleocarpae]TQV84116.1 hypothetical protein FKG94_05485 [Exilibacterium tricleocarpae]
MDSKLYEVVYIDKFDQREEASAVGWRFRRLFGLDNRTIAKLGSGKPIILKKNIPFNMAAQLKRLVEAIGGVCWVQPVPKNGAGHERRRLQRRRQSNRRGGQRADSALAERRISPGRRSTDWL